MRFKIEITETLQKVIEVKAPSLNDAIIKVAAKYENGEIILNEEDYKGYTINEYKE